MNIATSPDLNPISQRGESSAADAPPAGEAAGRPFDALLDSAPEDKPDWKPVPCKPPATPRQPPQDGTDPALTALLPFLLPQAPQTLPPAAPPATDGTALENAGGNSVAMPQVDSGPPVPVQTAALLLPDSGAPADSGGVPAIPLAPNKDATAPAFAAAEVISTEVVRSGETANPAAITPLAQPTQAVLPAKEAPAEIAQTAVENASSSALPPTGAVPENLSFQRRNGDATGTPEANGTVGAMQRRTMTEPFTERQPKTVTSVAGVFSKPGDSRAIFFPGKGERTADAGASAAPASAMLTLLADPSTDRGAGADVPAPADAVAAAQITRQTFEVTEQVRATGRDHAEVQLHLNDGQEVTVSLRLERGEWKPVFRTESESLCRALEQNWQRAAAQPTTPGVKFGQPTFETQRSQGQSDFSQNPQQQSGGRDRSFSHWDAEPETFFGLPIPQHPAKKVTRFSAAAAVQLYA